MTDVSNLKVSLTKHGAHKVAELITAFPKDQILENTWDKYRGIKIDRAQAEKNLSASPEGVLPDIWDEVRQLDEYEIDNLVFIAIVFSHHELINAMKGSRSGRMQGKLVRDELISGKAYTNTAHILDELGFSVQHKYEHVVYDLRRLFIDAELPRLIKILLTEKLKSAGWDGEGNAIIDECIRLGFHDVLAISSEDFREWLEGAPPDPFTVIDVEVDDEEIALPFHFTSGHQPRPGGAVPVRPRKAPSTAHLLHNDVQNKLYEYLVELYGEQAVGTELQCGYGSVDLVVSEEGSYTFYEIKTDTSLRSCIRQAIPQLLEYAYWPDQERARTLVIVSPNPPSASAIRYMKHLRGKFRFPVYYQQFDMDRNVLEDRY